MLRTLLPILALIGLPMMITGCRILPSALRESKPEPFGFVVIADPQVGMYKAFKETEGYDWEVRDFARANELVKELRPDFVVIAGDLVERWNDEEQIALFFDFVRALEEHTPVYLAAGNHDMAPSAEGLAFYRETYGADYYGVQHRGSRMIVLNSNLIFHSDRLPEEAQAQWEWLEEELAEANRAGVSHIFVVQHHPYFITEAYEEDQYFNIPMETRRRYLDLLTSHDVAAVFAGHYHREAGGTHEGMEQIISSSLGKPLGETPPGLRWVRVTKNAFEHEFVTLPPVVEEAAR